MYTIPFCRTDKEEVQFRQLTLESCNFSKSTNIIWCNNILQGIIKSQNRLHFLVCCYFLSLHPGWIWTLRPAIEPSCQARPTNPLKTFHSTLAFHLHTACNLPYRKENYTLAQTLTYKETQTSNSYINDNEQTYYSHDDFITFA